MSGYPKIFRRKPICDHNWRTLEAFEFDDKGRIHFHEYCLVCKEIRVHINDGRTYYYGEPKNTEIRERLRSAIEDVDEESYTSVW